MQKRFVYFANKVKFIFTYYRHDCEKCRSAGIVLLRGQLFGFAPEKRVLPCEFGREELTFLEKFTLIGGGLWLWVYVPKNLKNTHFTNVIDFTVGYSTDSFSS